MDDKIYWGNLQGLLKRGKWTLSLEEASALVQIYQETVRRGEPMKISDPEPIKPIKKEKK